MCYIFVGFHKQRCVLYFCQIPQTEMCTIFLLDFTNRDVYYIFVGFHKQRCVLYFCRIPQTEMCTIFLSENCTTFCRIPQTENCTTFLSYFIGQLNSPQNKKSTDVLKVSSIEGFHFECFPSIHEPFHFYSIYLCNLHPN